MRTIYLRKEDAAITRKILVDMAYLVTHNQIRIPVYNYEDDLYLPYFKGSDKTLSKHFLNSEEIFKKDKDFYYFKFPFKPAQVEDAAI